MINNRIIDKREEWREKKRRWEDRKRETKISANTERKGSSQLTCTLDIAFVYIFIFPTFFPNSAYYFSLSINEWKRFQSNLPRWINLEVDQFRRKQIFSSVSRADLPPINFDKLKIVNETSLDPSYTQYY